MDREQNPEQWLETVLGIASFRREPLLGDASNRHYERIHLETKSFIFMNSRQDKSLQQFVRIGQFLQGHGLRVPELVAQNLEQGWLLLTDFGTQHYWDALTETSAAGLYRSAFASLKQLHQLPTDGAWLAMDRDYFKTQFGIFTEWFLGQHLGLELSPAETALLIHSEDLIALALSHQPYVLTHKDFHSRNLMALPEGPGLIDFQDMLLGPITYDLVSLLRDAYIAWPLSQVSQWLRVFYEDFFIFKKHMSFAFFQQAFDFTGLHRHLRVLGIFARLTHRDGKQAYLKHIPQTLNYALTTASHYPLLQDFHQFLSQRVQPLCER